MKVRSWIPRIAEEGWRIVPTGGFWPRYERAGKCFDLSIRIAREPEPLGWVVEAKIQNSFVRASEVHFDNLNDALDYCVNL